MLAVFENQLTTQQTELEALLEKAASLRDGIKALKNQQTKVVKTVDSLKVLLTELPATVITELKAEILNLFPCEPTTQIATPKPLPANDLEVQTCNPAHQSPETFTNFVTEVPKAEEAQPWNPAHFEPMEYQAEEDGQLNLLQPTTTEPPEPDDYVNLQDFEAAWTEWKLEQEGEAEEELAHVSAKDFSRNLIDLSGENWEQLKTALKPVRQPKQFLIVKGEVTSVEETTSDDDDQWPEVEPITPVVEEPAPKTTDNDYAQTEYINDTVCYVKKYDGEILAGYIGTATKKLAEEWANLLILWGCNALARKAERIGKGIRWEVKITKISMEQLITVANNHPGLYSGVPQGNSEYTKKSTSGNAETKENLEESKTPLPQFNSPQEKSEISTEVKAAEDAEIILKGEQAKADILPNYSQPNQQKVFAGDLIRVKSNCHHKSVIGLTGVVTIASNAGCIAQFETIGNRWLTNDQVEIIKESQLVG